MNVSGFSDDNDSTIAANRSDVSFSDSTMSTLNDVIWYMVLSLGIPGNILSAIVWLRRRVVNKNSSAFYLAALAIDDLAFLLFDLILEAFNCDSGWMCSCCWNLLMWAAILEPFLVLGFSIERLIAILLPLRVRYFCFTFNHVKCTS